MTTQFEFIRSRLAMAREQAHDARLRRLAAKALYQLDSFEQVIPAVGNLLQTFGDRLSLLGAQFNVVALSVEEHAVENIVATIQLAETPSAEEDQGISLERALHTAERKLTENELAISTLDEALHSLSEANLSVEVVTAIFRKLVKQLGRICGKNLVLLDEDEEVKTASGVLDDLKLCGAVGLIHFLGLGIIVGFGLFIVTILVRGIFGILAGSAAFGTLESKIGVMEMFARMVETIVLVRCLPLGAFFLMAQKDMLLIQFPLWAYPANSLIFAVLFVGLVRLARVFQIRRVDFAWLVFIHFLLGSSTGAFVLADSIGSTVSVAYGANILLHLPLNLLTFIVSGSPALPLGFAGIVVNICNSFVFVAIFTFVLRWLRVFRWERLLGAVLSRKLIDFSKGK